MNPKASFGNFIASPVLQDSSDKPISARYASEIGVSLPSAAQDNSTSKLQRTLFLKFGSHYNLPIP
jgi:hypothetical protein